MCRPARFNLGAEDIAVRIGSGGAEGVVAGGRLVPTGENGTALINYLGPKGVFPRYSVSSILEGAVPKGTFRGKIVLVGITAHGLAPDDQITTPMDASSPGLEIHATMIDNILTGRYLNKPRWTGSWDFLAIILCGTAMALVLPRLGAVGGAAFALASSASFPVLGVWLLVAKGIWLNLTYPLTALGSTYSTLTVYRFLNEERQRRMIRNTFGRYVSASVIELRLKHPDRLRLGGEQKTLTVLFCDLVGFTDNSEVLGPDLMLKILGEYFKEMTEQIFRLNGVLKEYVGDELMAIYGAPSKQPDHAIRACSAALAMQRRLRVLREEWPRKGWPEERTAKIMADRCRFYVSNPPPEDWDGVFRERRKG